VVTNVNQLVGALVLETSLNVASNFAVVRRLICSLTSVVSTEFNSTESFSSPVTENLTGHVYQA